MNKLKFYVLASNNMHTLKRHINPQRSNIPKEDLYVIINTLNENFKDAAVEWCTKEKIDFSVTESDGTPATGKNSFLDIFSNSENDYAVLIDGDDFLTPHGVATYNKIANLLEPPDAVCLKLGFALTADYYSYGYIEHTQGLNPENFNGIASRYFYVKHWRMLIDGTLAREKYLQFASAKIDFNVLKNSMKEWAEYSRKSLDGLETHMRVTFISKRAAKYRFDNTMIVGEDVMNLIDLKHAAHNGEITMFKIDETLPTYIYEQRTHGISAYTSRKNDGVGWIDWLQLINKKFKQKEKENKIHEQKLPELNLDWPREYVPNTFGFGNKIIR